MEHIPCNYSFGKLKTSRMKTRDWIRDQRKGRETREHLKSGETREGRLPIPSHGFVYSRHGLGIKCPIMYLLSYFTTLPVIFLS